jgi:hypothetical protein
MQGADVSNELPDAALYYAGIGFPVFPCGFDKRPLTSHGFKDATRDLESIRGVWATKPTANIGIATEGLLVIDVDAPGSEIAVRLNGLCPTQQTPRGGRHFVFRRPEGRSWKNSQSKIAPKVDVRTNGGYILAAPSRTADGPYVWIESDFDLSSIPEPPAWLADMLDRASAEAPAPAIAPSVAPMPLDVETRAVAYLDAMPPAISGARGHSVTLDAARAMVYGFNLGAERGYHILASNYNPRCEPPWSERELRHKCREAEKDDYRKPRGWLLESSAMTIPAPDPGVNLSGILNQMNGASPRVVRESPPTEAIEDENEDIEAELIAGDPGTLPSELLHPPGFLSEYIEHCIKTAAYPNPILALAGALPCLSHVTARKIKGPTGLMPNVYAIGLAGSCGGKEHPRRVNESILDALGMAKTRVEEIASAEGLEDALITTPAILAQVDEFHVVLEAINNPKAERHNAIMAKMLKLYTGAGGTLVARLKAGSKERQQVSKPSLSLFRDRDSGAFIPVPQSEDDDQRTRVPPADFRCRPP